MSAIGNALSKMSPEEAARIRAAFAMMDARRWTPGDGPTDVWPIGFKRRDVHSYIYTVSEREFRILTTAPTFPKNQTFNVAESFTSPVWVAYVHERETGRRKLFRVRAPTATQAATLCRALGVPVPRPVVTSPRSRARVAPNRL